MAVPGVPAYARDMRLLRLGTSGDVDPAIPEHERMPAIAASVFTLATGEAVEREARVARPTPELPVLLDRWMQRSDPEMVVFVVNVFWFAFESVPLKLERRFGRFARPFTKAGRSAAAKPWPGDTRAFRVTRKLALRTIGGDAYFTTGEVLRITEECIKVVVARESTAMVIRGPWSVLGEDGGLDGLRDAESRRLTVNAGLEALCRRYHVKYAGRATTLSEREWKALSRGDGLHANAAGQRERGEAEGAAMVRAWLGPSASRRSDELDRSPPPRLS